jgi:hypothetical protein
LTPLDIIWEKEEDFQLIQPSLISFFTEILKMNVLTQILNLSLHNQVKIKMNFGEGIMSATNERSFIGFQLLYCSLVMRHKCEVCLVDLGINKKQMEWCEEQDNLLVLTANNTNFKFPAHEKCYKPYFLTLSPFQKTIWLDDTTMLLGDLTYLFNILKNEPVVFFSNFLINQHDVYFQQMQKKVPINSFCPCGSVTGFDTVRDFKIIEEWMFIAENVMKNPKIHISTKSFEDSSLALIVEKHKSEFGMHSHTWNSLAGKETNGRKYAGYRDAFHLISYLKRDFSNINIVNWGWFPPWLTWTYENYLLDISPHRITDCC